MACRNRKLKLQQNDVSIEIKKFFLSIGYLSLRRNDCILDFQVLAPVPGEMRAAMTKINFVRHLS